MEVREAYGITVNLVEIALGIGAPPYGDASSLRPFIFRPCNLKMPLDHIQFEE